MTANRTSDGKPYNHNGAPEELSQGLLDPELVASVKRMHFVKLDLDACLRALLTMPLEMRGFYVTAFLTMYSRMGTLPVDDRVSANLLGVPDMRVFRRLKTELTSRGHFVDRNGATSNARVEEEISKYVLEVKTKREKAVEREATKRVEIQKNTTLNRRISDDVRETSGRSINDIQNGYGVSYEEPRALAKGLGFSDVSKANADVTRRNTENVSDFSSLSTRPLPDLCQTSGKPLHKARALDSRLKTLEVDKLLPQDSFESVETLSEVEASDGRSDAEHLIACACELSVPAPSKKTGVPDQFKLDIELVGDGSSGKARYVYPADFDAFWRGYPETAGMSKTNAARAWRDLSASDKSAAAASLPAWKAFVAERRKKQPDWSMLHVQGFLNQKRFETLGAAAESSGSGSDVAGRLWWQIPEKLASVTDDQWTHLIRKHANGVWPIDKLGPPPAHRGSKAPAHVVDALGVRDLYDRLGKPTNGAITHG